MRGIGRLARTFRRYFFDPWEVAKKWRALPIFLRNRRRYRELATARSLPYRGEHAYYRTYDRYDAAGEVPTHYFLQDLWVARTLAERKCTRVVDFGSRVDGFVGHLLTFCRVEVVDIRPLSVEVDGLEFRRGSLLDPPYAEDSVETLTCLHVIEHVGLGRYGDPVNPDGHLEAAKRLKGILKPGGTLVVSCPVGVERLCFDAHRVLRASTVISMFEGLDLETFGLIDDEGREVREGAPIDEADACDYGCGIFVFRKPDR